MILGIGTDVCSVERISAARARPGFADRVFTLAEQGGSDQTMAGRFAAKEALAKALGAPGDLSWQDAWGVRGPDGAPSLHVSGSVAARAAALGVRSWHVSLSHDGGLAVAVVVAEG